MTLDFKPNDIAGFHAVLFPIAHGHRRDSADGLRR
jgi:hypothetical protein